MPKRKKLLLLGVPHRRITDFLLARGEELLMSEDPLAYDPRQLDELDFIVSYGYRHIIKKEIVEYCAPRVINLHCSFLPWNRGADPNVWSFLEDTPKGVTIHLIDSGIDTGAILAQREVQIGTSETLRSSYEKLSLAIEDLFMEKLDAIRSGEVVPVPQPPGGSYHRRKDLLPFERLLVQGWETPVPELAGKGMEGTKC
jgi:hypothetical protein